MSDDVTLRDVEEADLDAFFAYEHDAEAARRSRFAPRERERFMAHWRTEILGDAAVFAQTVTVDGEPAGHVVAWWKEGERFVGYWFGRPYWGRGVGTRALALFLQRETARPLHADPHVGNTGSVRLLEKLGFRRTGTDWEGEDEYAVLTLRADAPAPSATSPSERQVATPPGGFTSRQRSTTCPVTGPLSARPADTVLIIGSGDMSERVADGLAAGGRVRRVLVAGRSAARDEVATTVSSARDCLVEGVRLDASRQEDVAELLAATRPDLVVHCASLRSPWAMSGRTDPAARAVTAAGLGLRLPYQLPLVLTLMRAAQDAGYTGPVANLSFPDVTGPVLARLGLAPTVGLGNAAMMQIRVRAALRAAHPDRPLPLIRIVGHHGQVFDVMQARRPSRPEARCRVHLGEEGQRNDELAYQAPPLAPGPRYNVVTAAAVLPVLDALLPGAGPLRHSTAAPAGLPGGYPVRIDGGRITLDLPPGLTEAEAIGFNTRMAAGDGVDHIDEKGTTHLTDASRQAVADLAPELAEPIAVDDLADRAARLDAFLA